jgi:hypothetical protein
LLAFVGSVGNRQELQVVFFCSSFNHFTETCGNGGSRSNCGLQPNKFRFN